MREYKIKQLIQVEYIWAIKAKNKEDAERILKQGVYDNKDLLDMPIYREIKRGVKEDGDKNKCKSKCCNAKIIHVGFPDESGIIHYTKCGSCEKIIDFFSIKSASR